MTVSERTLKERSTWIRIIETHMPNVDQRTRVVDAIKKSCKYGGVEDELYGPLHYMFSSNFSRSSIARMIQVGKKFGYKPAKFDMRCVIVIGSNIYYFDDWRRIEGQWDETDLLAKSDMKWSDSVPEGIARFNSVADAINLEFR